MTLMMGTLRKADCHGTTSLAMTDREINRHETRAEDLSVAGVSMELSTV